MLARTTSSRIETGPPIPLPNRAKAATEAIEPSWVLTLTERSPSRILASLTLKLLPQATAERTENTPPIVTLSVTEVDASDPTAARPVTLRDDPRRTNDRVETELPATVCPAIDALPPVRALHSAERLRPKRTKLRAESEDRKAEEAPTDKELPTTSQDLTDIELDTVTASFDESDPITPPTRMAPETLKLLPKRAKLRVERALLKTTCLNAETFRFKDAAWLTENAFPATTSALTVSDEPTRVNPLTEVELARVPVSKTLRRPPT